MTLNTRFTFCVLEEGRENSKELGHTVDRLWLGHI